MLRAGYKFQSVVVGYQRYLSGCSRLAGDQKSVDYLGGKIEELTDTGQPLIRLPRLFDRLRSKEKSIWRPHLCDFSNYALRDPRFGDRSLLAGSTKKRGILKRLFFRS